MIQKWLKLTHDDLILQIFDSTLENTDSDFIVFTNSDIGLQKISLMIFHIKR